ncbi:hypothetical protein NG99_09440 [Erwinia typographi]|uniref:Uncharacterized protein n=1 Tax=Erwinia typographi TaxID=371042 RepID=A0A0A3Z9P2_9GAMM|nr:hypothetical protein NG99_09440 [Erwinia typographi]
MFVRLKKLTRNHTGGTGKTQGNVAAGGKLFGSLAPGRRGIACYPKDIMALAKKRRQRVALK